mgnify:CR=1 FL=1
MTRSGLLGLTALLACNLVLDDGEDASEVARAVVGPDGGVLEGTGVQLQVPAGALSEDVELSVRRVDEDGANGVRAVSPVYRFEPEGVTFAEPARVTLQVDEPEFMTLYWSVEGDDTAFEAVGVGAAGEATGWTHHFSLAYAGAGACELPQPPASVTRCVCRASDEVGDLLCKADPSMNTDAPGTCPDLDAYSGTDGAGCSGYGPRDETQYACACLSGDGDYLCPDAHVFQPMQQCPSEGGLQGFMSDSPSGSCSGTTVVQDPETGVLSNESKSGTLVDCGAVITETKYDNVSGSLEGCYETSEASDGTCPSDGPPQPQVSMDCQARIAALEKKRVDAGLPRTACLEPPISPVVGTEIGQHLELGLFATDADHLTQVKIPWGSKSECDMDTSERTSPGFLDLLEVVSRDEASKTVTIRFAEIKPMTSSGLAKGREDLDCYAARVADAGARCKDTLDDGSSLTEYVDFCARLGAIGWTVALAEPTADHPEGYKLRWAPSAKFAHKFKAAPGDTRDVLAIVCEDGITTYECLE